MNPSPIELIGAILFALAILHTFSTKLFDHLAQRRPNHAGLFHLLSEVEVVFGFWAIVLVVFMALVSGHGQMVEYLDTRNYTEPLFVFAIMVVAASKPVMQVASFCVRTVARKLPLNDSVTMYFTILALVPLLGSFITEPAAMTLAALMLRQYYYRHGISAHLMYLTIGTLFVNVSIGGTLTNFAAPPVLMVATTWDWSTLYMVTHFGWKSAIAVLINAATATAIFYNELNALETDLDGDTEDSVPRTMVGTHLFMLLLIVVFAHHPPIFLGVFLTFMGLATAYPRYQERLILREGLMVAFFLSGLIILGGQQAWWLQPLLAKMDASSVYFGAMALTAITDNAALTYLASLVDGLTEEFKYAVVAGAVTGGGLTVIANAPNPAGISILRRDFENGVVNALGLLIAAAPPTVVAIVCFRIF